LSGSWDLSNCGRGAKSLSQLEWKDGTTTRYNGVHGCNPFMDGTWSEGVTNTIYWATLEWDWSGWLPRSYKKTHSVSESWTGQQIFRAMAVHCEGYALREPVSFLDGTPALNPLRAKMYGGWNWYCKKEGCWPSGQICGRDGGPGIPDLGCFAESKLYGSLMYGYRRYWGGESAYMMND